MSNTLEETQNDPYLARMLDDLKRSEYALLADISNKENPFRTDGESRLKDSQANVDRLHELIRSYCAEQRQRLSEITGVKK